MPILRPIPIVTRGLPFWRKVWVLLTAQRQWELVDNWVFMLPCGVYIIIPKGFIMDGASTPKFMWGILDPTGILLLQGIVHDYGYRFDYLWAYDNDRQLYKLYGGRGRKFWDDLFLAIGRDVVDLQVTGYLSYGMLRLLGWIAWNKNRKLNQADIIIYY